MKVVRMVFVIVLLVAVAVFAAQNTGSTTVAFLGWSVSGSISLLLVLAVIAGFLIGTLIMLPSILRKKFQSSGLRRRVSKLEREKDKLNKMVSEASASEAPSEASKAEASKAETPPSETPVSQL
ncbi:MAG TPA: LapA family protein [Rectinemataceae bacterium]